MNSSSMRRLATDQASLRRSTPPNYLFPEEDDGSGFPDDLTQLNILLTGARDTPYSQGLWRLHLKMPDDYPKNPPKATFKTRIYHPNVEESTGAVCLDTLKKDWQSKLTLRDVLITISCLLIQPNPDSALNSTAGSLLQEDFDSFARQAKLMTSIHAPIPSRLKSAVQEAKHRGEEGGVVLEERMQERPATSRAASSSSSLVMKKNKPSAKKLDISIRRAESQERETTTDEQEHDEAKENDPSQSPSPVSPPPLSPRNNVLGKRPLSELPTPTEIDNHDPIDGEAHKMTDSEKNVLAGHVSQASNEDSEPVRKSPKLSRSVQVPQQKNKPEKQEMQIFEDVPCPSLGGQAADDEKENANVSEKNKEIEVMKNTTSTTRPTLRKVSNVGSSRAKARTGIRRL